MTHLLLPRSCRHAPTVVLEGCSHLRQAYYRIWDRVPKETGRTGLRVHMQQTAAAERYLSSLQCCCIADIYYRRCNGLP